MGIYKVEDVDPDPMGVQFEHAVNEEDISGLTAIAAYYRARAAAAEGRLAEVDRTIAAKDEAIRLMAKMLANHIDFDLTRG